MCLLFVFLLRSSNHASISDCRGGIEKTRSTHQQRKQSVNPAFLAGFFQQKRAKSIVYPLVPMEGRRKGPQSYCDGVTPQSTRVDHQPERELVLLVAHRTGVRVGLQQDAQDSHAAVGFPAAGPFQKHHFFDRNARLDVKGIIPVFVHQLDFFGVHVDRLSDKSGVQSKILSVQYHAGAKQTEVFHSLLLAFQWSVIHNLDQRGQDIKDPHLVGTIGCRNATAIPLLANTPEFGHGDSDGCLGRQVRDQRGQHVAAAGRHSHLSDDLVAAFPQARQVEGCVPVGCSRPKCIGRSPDQAPKRGNVDGVAHCRMEGCVPVGVLYRKNIGASHLGKSRDDAFVDPAVLA
mmetsp:Transcript_21222/g.50153  ORF Transcript_21222/g.50153 Transcript_21222/m.50153 type:complete len:346 (+) Transcript_21222:249-1286(+)